MSQSYSQPTFDQGAEYNKIFYIVYMTKEKFLYANSLDQQIIV